MNNRWVLYKSVQGIILHIKPTKKSCLNRVVLQDSISWLCELLAAASPAFRRDLC